MASRLPWRRIAIPLALYVASVLVRWRFAFVAPYGDEGAFFWVARDPPGDFSRFHDLYVPDGFAGAAAVLYRPIPIFWYRPMHFLVLWPGATASFEAYRILHLFLTATIPVLAWYILRAHGTRAGAAAGAAAATFLVPLLAVWTTFTLPDALMTVWFLAGVWAWLAHRPAWSGLALAAAAWTKEAALIGIVAVLAYDLLGKRTSLWPLRLDRMQTAWCAALAIGAIPTVISLSLGGITPGGRGGVDVPWLIDQLVVTAWLWPVLVAGLWMARARAICFVALAFPVWYLVYGILLGHGVNTWYLVLPNVLALLGTAAVLDAAAHDVRPVWRRASRVAGVVVCAVLLAHILLPYGAAEGRIKNPVSGAAEDDFAQAYAYETHRDQALWEVADFVAEADSLMLVDVYGAHGIYPLGAHAHDVWVGATWAVRILGQDIGVWNQTVESVDFVVLAQNDEPLNRAVRTVYAECMVLVNHEYAVIQADGCNGRGDALAMAYRAS